MRRFTNNTTAIGSQIYAVLQIRLRCFESCFRESVKTSPDAKEIKRWPEATFNSYLKGNQSRSSP